MKTNPIFKIQLAALLLLSTLNPQLSTVFAQGSLTPPGAPAPTMKTLSQVEPRTPITSAPFTIPASGSYYLTTNVTVGSGNAITIAANNVTLDLNGFTISSTENPANTGYGIALGSGGGVTNVTILNGFISGGVTTNGSGTYSGPGFGYGISYSSWSPVNVRVSGVSVSGCLRNGIVLYNNGSVVQACTVNTVGGYGISAQSVSDSTALNCGNGGVLAFTANNCCAQGSSSSPGVEATVANNCYGSGTIGHGVFAQTANNCYGLSSTAYGVAALIAHNCDGISDSGIGLSANYVDNCYGSGNSAIGVDAVTATGCSGGSSSGYAVRAKTALNCYGTSSTGIGVYADNANNCEGSSGTNYGVYAIIAHNCIGKSSSGTGLVATNADNCYGSSGGELRPLRRHRAELLRLQLQLQLRHHWPLRFRFGDRLLWLQFFGHSAVCIYRQCLSWSHGQRHGSQHDPQRQHLLIYENKKSKTHSIDTGFSLQPPAFSLAPRLHDH